MKSHGKRAGDRDMEVAIADLSERLPASISALAGIAYDYRWTWHLEGPPLFCDIDPAAWQRSGQNARWMIEAVPPHRLAALASDAGYVERVRRVAACLETDRLRPSIPGAISPAHPVAYFCSEFGGHASLPLYGGGLGVLAGDLVKAASDLALPLVGMSLFYREGYFRQRLDHSGWQIEYWTPTSIERLPAVLVTDGHDPRCSCSTTPGGIGGRSTILEIRFPMIEPVDTHLLNCVAQNPDPDAMSRNWSSV